MIWLTCLHHLLTFHLECEAGLTHIMGVVSQSASHRQLDALTVRIDQTYEQNLAQDGVGAKPTLRRKPTRGARKRTHAKGSAGPEAPLSDSLMKLFEELDDVQKKSTVALQKLLTLDEKPAHELVGDDVLSLLRQHSRARPTIDRGAAQQSSQACLEASQGIPPQLAAAEGAKSASATAALRPVPAAAERRRTSAVYRRVGKASSFGYSSSSMVDDDLSRQTAVIPADARLDATCNEHKSLVAGLLWSISESRASARVNLIDSRNEASLLFHEGLLVGVDAPLAKQILCRLGVEVSRGEGPAGADAALHRWRADHPQEQFKLLRVQRECTEELLKQFAFSYSARGVRASAKAHAQRERPMQLHLRRSLPAMLVEWALDGAGEGRVSFSRAVLSKAHASLKLKPESLHRMRLAEVPPELIEVFRLADGKPVASLVSQVAEEEGIGTLLALLACAQVLHFEGRPDREG